MDKKVQQAQLTGGIWAVPDVASEPAIRLSDWRVVELEEGTRHLIGWNEDGQEGRVSSAIEAFDAKTGRLWMRASDVRPGAPGLPDKAKPVTDAEFRLARVRAELGNSSCQARHELLPTAATAVAKFGNNASSRAQRSRSRGLFLDRHPIYSDTPPLNLFGQPFAVRIGTQMRKQLGRQAYISRRGDGRMTVGGVAGGLLRADRNAGKLAKASAQSMQTRERLLRRRPW